MARIRSAVLLLPVALAGCFGGGGMAIQQSQGPQLVLQPADLPSVFTQFDGGKQVRADYLPGPREDPTRFDRVNGWKARFKRGGDAETPGPLVVESRLDLFEDAGGAERDLEAYREQFEADGSGRFIDVPELGDEAVAWTFVQSGSPPVRYTTIAWRNANAAAAVAVNGFDGKVTLGQALALARKQERRLVAAAESK